MLIARRLMVAVRAMVALLLSGVGTTAFVSPAELGVHSIEGAAATEFVAFWLLTSLTFAAFPRSRRNELTEALVFLGVSTAIIRPAVDARLRLYSALAATIGVLAVYLPSHLEALLKHMRDGPMEPMFSARASRQAKGAEAVAQFRRPIPPPIWPVAWALGALVVATLCPQSPRPQLADAQRERFYAYFLTAASLAATYPKRPIAVAASAALAAVLLEPIQFLAPGRDPSVDGAIQKALGGVAGALTTWIAAHAWLSIAAALRPRPSARPTRDQRRTWDKSPTRKAI